MPLGSLSVGPRVRLAALLALLLAAPLHAAPPAQGEPRPLSQAGVPNPQRQQGRVSSPPKKPVVRAPVPQKPGSPKQPTVAPDPAQQADPNAAKAQKPPKPPKPDASDSFFRDGAIPRLKIQIPDAELQQLRQQNREYVRCTVLEDDQVQYEQVGIHLKGAAGSFRGIDQNPALTLNFDKFQDGQTFHDLDKIHLNNSVQDPTLLNELLCSELFLAAGIPAARTTHARVWLNGRDLGIYVLKEGFDKRFLKRNHLGPDGNLYEGGFVQDLDGQPKLQSGGGPIDRSDVKAIVAACREGDPAKRWERLEQLVDLDRFLTFMAMELMTAHWDGYCNNRNNYRFYFDPKSGKLQFFPHGMDQMFGDPGYSVTNAGAMVCRAVLSNPEWRSRYGEKVRGLLPLFVPPDRLLQRVDQVSQRLLPLMGEISANPNAWMQGPIRSLKDRLAARARSLTQQAGVPEPPRPPAAGQKPVPPPALPVLSQWQQRLETADARLADTTLGTPKQRILQITAGPGGRCVASWRTRVTLPQGRYRFEAKARAEGLKPLQEGPGAGAGVRISGSTRTNHLEGTTGWTPLAFEFEIQAPMQEVELVADLRASAGQVFFDAASLKLTRLPR